MNRWTAPLSVATLLAVPAVLLGWNASAIASTITEPWTEPTAAGAPVRSPGAQEPAPAGEVSPAPAAVPTVVTVAEPAPARTVVVVQKTVRSTVTATKEDDVSTSDERGTDSGAPPIDSPVEPTDPAPTETAPDSDAVTTPGGQTVPADGYVDEDGQRYYGNGSTGNIPPSAGPDDAPETYTKH